MKYIQITANDLEKFVEKTEEKINKMSSKEKEKFFQDIEKKKLKDFNNYCKKLKPLKNCKQWTALLVIPKNAKSQEDIYFCRAFGKVKDKWLCGYFTLKTVHQDIQNTFVSESEMLIPDEISLARIEEKISSAFIAKYKNAINDFVKNLNNK